MDFGPIIVLLGLAQKTATVLSLLMERNSIVPVINILIIGTIYCEALSAFRG